MARAVVLYFEDNADAEFYVELHRRASGNKWFSGKGSTLPLMVAVPTQFCEGGHKRGKFSNSYTRGLKWGWWVCAICRKPSGHPSFMKRLRSCLGQARNLLEDQPQEVSEVTDVGWGASGRSAPRVSQQ